MDTEVSDNQELSMVRESLQENVWEDSLQDPASVDASQNMDFKTDSILEIKNDSVSIDAEELSVAPSQTSAPGPKSNDLQEKRNRLAQLRAMHEDIPDGQAYLVEMEALEACFETENV